MKSKTKNNLKSGFKRVLFIVRTFFLIILSATLITTYYSIESKKTFVISLLGTIILAFIITYFLGTYVFKKKGWINGYFSEIWKISALAIILNLSNLAILITSSYFPFFLNYFVEVISIIVSAKVIQNISFFKMV